MGERVELEYYAIVYSAKNKPREVLVKKLIDTEDITSHEEHITVKGVRHKNKCVIFVKDKDYVINKSYTYIKKLLEKKNTKIGFKIKNDGR